MACSPSAAPELRSEERSQLIQRLSNLTGVVEINSAIWAIVWFADIDALRDCVEFAASKHKLHVNSTLRNGLRGMRILKLWLGRLQEESEAVDPVQPADPALAESSQLPRKIQQPQRSSVGLSRGSQTSDANDLAKTRDKERCVLTKMDEPIQVCHLSPYRLGQKSEDVRDFWEFLELFWSPQTIAAWQRDILGNQGTELCQKMLTLNTLAHELWGMARFALEPVEISEDRKTFTMRFWRLPRTLYSKQVWMCDPPSLSSELRSGPGRSMMVDCDTEDFIRSGQLIRLTTEDPEAMPLPSFELLHMQWILHRVATIAGAADVTDDELDEDLEFY